MVSEIRPPELLIDRGETRFLVADASLPQAVSSLFLFQSDSQISTSRHPVANHLVGYSSAILLPQVCNYLSMIN